MSELYVDPDSLTAVSEVAHRQYTHVGRVSNYIATECSQFGAFSGVLNLFEGSYRSAVTTALEGMSDGQSIATKVQTTVADCRKEYVSTDHEVYESFKELLGKEQGFPPYVAPGSGRTTPGGPLEDAPTPDPEGKDGDPFGLKKLPPYLSGPLDRVMPGPDGGDVPGILNPQDAAKNAILDAARQRQLEHDYMEYRDQGMTPEQAAQAAHMDVDDIASEHVHTQTQERAEGAYDAAHDQAIADGRTEDEATTAGQDAAQEQHHGDAGDHGKRDDVADAGGTYLGAYNEASDAVDNVTSIVDHVEQLGETQDDVGDYDDYENKPDDDSAQHWGNK